ncbi:MAG: hypothetical protein ACRDKL_10175 [Solirubrobacteraceae bacterium]
MSAKDLNHFLVVYRISLEKAEVRSFGHDYRAALDAYNRAEEEHREAPDVEVVLLGSDSIETLKRTHSSYFELSEKNIDQVVTEVLAAAGFSPR